MTFESTLIRLLTTATARCKPQEKRQREENEASNRLVERLPRPTHFRKRVDLHTSLDQIHRLGRRDHRPLDPILAEHVSELPELPIARLRLLDELLGRRLDGRAELGPAGELGEEGVGSGEKGRVGVLLDLGDEEGEDADGGVVGLG